MKLINKLVNECTGKTSVTVLSDGNLAHADQVDTLMKAVRNTLTKNKEVFKEAEAVTVTFNAQGIKYSIKGTDTYDA